MRRAASSAAARQVAALFRVGVPSGLGDSPLLERFLSGPPEEAQEAFALLVDRHAPMVLRACRRILGDRHDAEDAAQAAFLVLAQRARSIRQAESVAGWLHGVAGRIATRARRDADRRMARERSSVEGGARAVRLATEAPPEGSAELHEELGRLPDRFRLPILLCHLEGLTYEQAAQHLGCPARTIQSRLARGRQRLRDRLIRRGVSPGVLPLGVILGREATTAFVSETWKRVTLQAAVSWVARGVRAAIVSAEVVAMARGASRAMMFHRMMRWAAALAFLGVAAGGTGVVISARSTPARSEQATPAAAAAEGRPYRIMIGGGAEVEVVAVSTIPTGPGTWWRPDGSRLAEPPVDAITAKSGMRDGEVDRVILVRVSGLRKDDLFRWSPTPSSSYWGGTPMKDGKGVPGLEYYEAAFPRDRAEAAVRARVATGPWKTAVTNDGQGGTGLFVDGHKFSFGRARPSTAHGRPTTVFSVAHNFFGQDRRLVAVDREGAAHPAVSYSMGSDGDERWVIDLIDGEFGLTPDQIKEYQVQFRPIEVSEIKAIALDPRPGEGIPAR